MAYELEKGDECMLSGDFKSEGKPAFNRGDIVRIEDISPDRLQPGNKYLVNSALLGGPVRLPGMVLRRISCPQCKQRLAPGASGGFADSCPCGWSDVEGAHAKSVQQMSEFNDKVSKQRWRMYARPLPGAYDQDDDTPLAGSIDSLFNPTESQPVRRATPEAHVYACPVCGVGIAVATECPHCGWRYQSAVTEPEKKPARMVRDVVIEGAVAFRAGDWVVVEAESPDPQRPQFKYVVLSSALKRKFLLSDADLIF